MTLSTGRGRTTRRKESPTIRAPMPTRSRRSAHNGPRTRTSTNAPKSGTWRASSTDDASQLSPPPSALTAPVEQIVAVHTNDADRAGRKEGWITRSASTSASITSACDALSLSFRMLTLIPRIGRSPDTGGRGRPSRRERSPTTGAAMPTCSSRSAASGPGTVTSANRHRSGCQWCSSAEAASHPDPPAPQRTIPASTIRAGRSDTRSRVRSRCARHDVLPMIVSPSSRTPGRPSLPLPEIRRHGFEVLFDLVAGSPGCGWGNCCPTPRSACHPWVPVPCSARIRQPRRPPHL